MRKADSGARRGLALRSQFATSKLRQPEAAQRYASASFLADNAVIFNVKGNRYRLEVLVAHKDWHGSNLKR